MEIISEFRGRYRWLSNFWPSAIVYSGAEWPTVEHAYQGAKTFDVQQAEDIRTCATPGLAKRLGRKVTKRPDWDDVRITIMHDLLRRKFQIPYLRALLLRTGDAMLVEGNNWNDTFWGVCNGHGQNQLGKLLMRVRDELRAE